MGYAILLTEKGKGSASELAHHIDRDLGDIGYEGTYRNADPKRKHLNYEWTTKPINDLIDKRILAGYIGKKTVRKDAVKPVTGKQKVRKDAVKYVSFMLSGSPEDMIKITNEHRLPEWVLANKKWVTDNFGGEDNLVRFTVHQDETSPHIHAIIVPLLDGRLSAKLFLGTPEKLINLQTSYAVAMSPFKLKRGKRGIHGRFNTQKEHGGIVAEAMEPLIQTKKPLITKDEIHQIISENLPVPGRAIFNLEKWQSEQVDKLTKSIEPLIRTAETIPISDFNAHTLTNKAKIKAEATNRELSSKLTAMRFENLELKKKITLSVIPQKIQNVILSKIERLKLFQGEIIKKAVEDFPHPSGSLFTGIIAIAWEALKFVIKDWIPPTSAQEKYKPDLDDDEDNSKHHRRNRQGLD